MEKGAELGEGEGDREGEGGKGIVLLMVVLLVLVLVVVVVEEREGRGGVVGKVVVLGTIGMMKGEKRREGRRGCDASYSYESFVYARIEGGRRLSLFSVFPLSQRVFFFSGSNRIR